MISTIAFYNLVNHYSHLIIQEIVKFDFKIESIKINNNIIFIDNFQFLSYSLDSLVKNLGKDDFKYLNQYLNRKILDLDLLVHSYPYQYMSSFEKLKKNRERKENFIVP